MKAKSIQRIIRSIPIAYLFIIWLKYLIYRFIISNKWKTFYLIPGVKIFSVPNKHKKLNTFFGYYNISPFFGDTKIIYCGTESKNYRGSQGFPCEIYYCDLLTNESVKVGTSKSWNWQQGCMLQWLNNSEDKVIFNNYSDKEDKYVCLYGD